MRRGSVAATKQVFLAPIALRSHDDLVKLAKWGGIPLADAWLYAMIDLSIVNGHQPIAPWTGDSRNPPSHDAPSHDEPATSRSDVAMNDHGRRTTHAASSSNEYDPNAAPLRRDVLIEDVARELKRRHGGNDVLNCLEAEIIVDHYLERRPDPRRGNVEEIIRSARKAALSS